MRRSRPPPLKLRTGARVARHIPEGPEVPLKDLVLDRGGQQSSLVSMDLEPSRARYLRPVHVIPAERRIQNRKAASLNSVSNIEIKILTSIVTHLGMRDFVLDFR